MDSNNYIHEVYSTVTEKTIKRLWVLCIVTLLCFVVSNVYWIWYSKQFQSVETTTIEATQDGESANFISGGNLSYVTEGENYQN